MVTGDNATVDNSQVTTVALPFESPPASLRGNARTHWRRRSADTKAVRTAVAALVRGTPFAAGGPYEHLTVTLTWAPGDRRRRDADNLYPLLKAACDALARGPRQDWVGLELVPDDTPRWMTKYCEIQGPDVTSELGLFLAIEPRRRAS